MKQVDMRLKPQPTAKAIDLDERLLLGCNNWRDALKVGIAQSRNIYTANELAECLDISHSHFNEILNKKVNKYFDFDRIDELESFLGNHAVTQFLQLQRKRLLHKFNREESSDDEVVEMYRQGKLKVSV